MKARILGSIAVLLLGAPIASNAVTLSPTQPVYFNFDISGLSGGAPFDTVSLSWGIGFGSYIPISSTLYGGLDKTGTATSFGLPGLPVGIATSFAPGLSDGIFSVELTSSSLTYEITSVCAGGAADGRIIEGCIPGTVGGGTTAVPEPATLGLLGLALAAVGFVRRRSAQAAR